MTSVFCDGRRGREIDRHILSDFGIALLLIHGPHLLSSGSDMGLNLSRDGLVWSESTSSEGGVETFEIADEALGNAPFV
jgi:hypothetical protein